MTIPITRPSLGDEEIQAIAEVIRSGWVTQGPQVAGFEAKFAKLVGANHACAVSSCTAALHLALLTIGVRAGDEVITVSHSFIATANSIRYCGATPVFVDIAPEGFNIDPSKIRAVISPRTRAILCVHQVGMPCDMQAIMEIANSYGLPVIEDAACAAGSEILWDGRWEKIGKPHGHIACFSFHPRKLITTGDGGILTTNNAEWDKQFRFLRQHGMSISDSLRHSAKKAVREIYIRLGFNYRMTDLQAAVGSVQLDRLPGLILRRRVLAANYQFLLAEFPNIKPPSEPSWARSNWQSYYVTLPEQADQGQVLQGLRDAGIASKPGIMCAHREPAYADLVWSCGRKSQACNHRQGQCHHLPRSEYMQDRTVLLPLFDQMTESDQRFVIESLSTLISQP